MSDPKARDVEIHKLATAHGCAPIWAVGILGWAWHCTCADGTHYCDQQCSAISLRSAVQSKAGPCVWCAGSGYIATSRIICRTCHGTGNAAIS